LYDVTTKYIL